MTPQQLTRLEISPGQVSKMTREELLELIDITDRWSDSKDHKFYLYQPNPIPAYYHASNAKIRAMFGGNRSSKTYSGMIDYGCQFKGEAPESIANLVPPHRLNKQRKNRLCMPDYPNSFMKVIWPYVKRLIPADNISDVIKDSGRIKAIVNDKGGFLEFMQYDQEVGKFQGADLDSVGYDECPPQAIRDENLMRLVDRDGEETYNLTPTSEANAGASDRWLLDEIAEKACKTFELDEETKELIVRENPEGSPDTEVFFADSYDNKYVSKDALDRILSKYTTEEKEMRQKGKFMFFAGLVYKEFSDKNLIEPIKEWWKGDTYTIYCALDPHPRVPHALLIMAVDKYNIMYLVDELFVETKTSKDLVDLINAKLMGKIPELNIVDPIANTPDPINGGCLAFDLAESGMYPVPMAASKDKSRGIIQVRGALSFKDRTLYICRNCVRTRFEITHYVWDSYKKDTMTHKGTKQKPVDKDDHMMENLYSLLLLNPQYISPVSDEFDDYYENKPKLGKLRNGY